MFINLKSYPNIKVKAKHTQTAVKVTASKIGTQVMVRVVTKYGKWYLHQVVTRTFLDT